MRLLKMMKLGVFTLACSIILMSCGEDGLLGGLVGDENKGQRSFLTMFDNEDTIDVSCAEIVYPITLNNPDGSTTTINDDDELIEAIEDALFDDSDVPTIAFPIQVIGEDDIAVTVADEDALFEIFEDCFGDWDDYDDDCGCEDDEFEECFEINYPITLVMPDGSQVVVNDDDELETAIDNYYDANPNDTNDISVVYPITVTMLEDSSTVTVNDDDELDELFEDCFDEYFEDCFEIQYPISILMPDSTTITANSEEELDSLYDAWIIANPNNMGEPELIFPITIVYEDGTTEVINDEDELEEAFEACYGDDFCEMVDGTDIVIGTSETVVSRVAMKKKQIHKAKTRIANSQ